MRAIIFDIDGTLIESMAVDTELYFASVRSVLGPVSVREPLSAYEHVTDSGILAALVEDNGLAADDGVEDAVRSLFVDGLRRHIDERGPFPVIPGAIEMLARTRRARDTAVAIATGGWRASAMLKLETSGFDVDGMPIVTCDESPARIEIMQTALDRLGGRFDSVTYFGDAKWDRRAAATLGWNFVAVGPGLGGLDSFAEPA